MPKNHGVVVALGGSPIDLVVATDLSVSFLQVTTDPYFVFRVYEKIVLRIKEEGAIELLRNLTRRQRQRVTPAVTPTPTPTPMGGSDP